MLPVSGAEQLNTSGAHARRPMTSHSGAYSRLVSVPPWSLGRHKFHKPAARALGLRSSMMRVGIQAFPLRRFSSISSKKRFSFGKMCASMNTPTFLCSSLTLSEKLKSMLLSLVCAGGYVRERRSGEPTLAVYYRERRIEIDRVLRYPSTAAAAE